MVYSVEVRTLMAVSAVRPDYALPDATTMLIMLYIAAIPTLTGYLLWNRSVEYIGAARAGIPASSHIVPGRQGPIVRQDRGNGGDRNLDHIVFRLKNGQPLQPEPRLGNRPGQQAV